MKPFINKKTLNLLFVSGVLLGVFACTRNKPGWGETLDRQMNQPGSILPIDSVVVNFMVKYKIPGMSIAVSKDGKMIYRKGYGYANKTTAAEVTSKTLFRIGKGSELLTAIAIMKLMEDGKLSLESKVFGDSGILGNDYGHPPYGRNITAITVNELLHHNCGGWAGGDDPTWNPKFRDLALNPAELISLTLKDIPLRNSPGSTFAFSDFGYLVLGRVIEKASGISYSSFVKERILHPIGISDMQIEGSSAEDTAKNEAIYYSDAFFPILRSEEIDKETYAYTAMGDACYGWIASTEDLLRIVASLDDSIPKAPVLTPKALRMLFSADKTNPHYGCGIVWNQEFNNWYNLGDYRGSSSEYARASNGYSWAILVNTYRPALNDFFSDLDQIMWSAIGNPATRWPDKDLF